ncbi:uncharacterized protein BO95DRAFT_1419 [Aspergillus brunneoviolaceus CBS 621.78]|uniref:Uncharacterized protein n=1 Tax=Aspergillus brunneoviolaceus CBS 621.78 TaxID=1450534 RepID=A0ACD1GQ63_9EURO|nr:hypothetical protein BO95DRAFT_1419 [Aspergillus brunneoviolaceus CBS 621.78]RAH51371.1 hypothetical protein BO95DRAFT_1419 [Aspergillus brunneoviolaceus CBS 621.78]
MTARSRSAETQDPPTKWSCASCDAIFQRIDHYKRHITSHSADKPYQCSFCASRYRRGDVLRRHWKTCPARHQAGYAIPEPRTGGKERHACDACARLKKACDGGNPCLECGIKGREECTYRRVDESSEGTVVQSERLPEPQLGSGSGEDPAALPWTLGPGSFYSLDAAKESTYRYLK